MWPLVVVYPQHSGPRSPETRHPETWHSSWGERTTLRHQLKLCLGWHRCVWGFFSGPFGAGKTAFSVPLRPVSDRFFRTDKVAECTEPGDNLGASSSAKIHKPDDRSLPWRWSGSRKTPPENRQLRLFWIPGKPGGRAPGRTAGGPSCPQTIPGWNRGKRGEDEPSWSRLVPAACFSRLQIGLGWSSDVMEGVGGASDASLCRKKAKVCRICTAAAPAAILDSQAELCSSTNLKTSMEKRPTDGEQRNLFTPNKPFGFIFYPQNPLSAQFVSDRDAPVWVANRLKSFSFYRMTWPI